MLCVYVLTVYLVCGGEVGLFPNYFSYIVCLQFWFSVCVCVCVCVQNIRRGGTELPLLPGRGHYDSGPRVCQVEELRWRRQSVGQTCTSSPFESHFISPSFKVWTHGPQWQKCASYLQNLKTTRLGWMLPSRSVSRNWGYVPWSHPGLVRWRIAPHNTSG